MKNSFKRLGALIITVTMIFSLLAACVAQEGSKVTGNGSQTSTISGTDAPKEIIKDPVKIKIMVPESNAGAEFGYATGLPKVKEIERRTGVEIEWEVYPRQDYGKVFTARVSAGIDLPDTFEPVSLANALRWANEGLFIPLNDLIDKYGPNIQKRYNEDFPDMWSIITQDDGNIYYLQRFHSGIGGDLEVLMYREDWLEQAGIAKVPETTDEFYSYLKAVQDRDANNNGQRDEVLTVETIHRLFCALSPTFGVPIYSTGVVDGWQERDGELFYPWITSEAKEMATYLNKLWKENLLWNKTRDIGGGTLQEYQELAANNALAATSHFPASANVNIPNLVKGVEGVKYSVLKPLIGPQGHGRENVYRQPLFPYRDAFIITKDSKNPDAVMRLYDFMMSEEGYELNAFGIEGEHWERNSEGLMVQTKKWQETMEKDPNAWKKFGILSCFPVWTFTSFEQFSISWRKDVRDTVAEIINLPMVNRELPSLANATEAEQEVLNMYLGELKTYTWNTFLDFIRGVEPLSKWDDYVKRTNDLGLEKVKDIQQARYNRVFKK